MSPVDKMAIKEQALLGKLSQAEYREAQIRLYGITDPQDIQRGVQALEEEDNDVLFFEGVRETLLTLKEQGFLLGIVTDTAFPVHVKLDWLERGGFGHVWDTFISSNELGIHKPDPGIYQAALQQLGLEASQAVFVGHMASELEGADRLGSKPLPLITRRLPSPISISIASLTR